MDVLEQLDEAMANAYANIYIRPSDLQLAKTNSWYGRDEAADELSKIAAEFPELRLEPPPPSPRLDSSPEFYRRMQEIGDDPPNPFAEYLQKTQMDLALAKAQTSASVDDYSSSCSDVRHFAKAVRSVLGEPKTEDQEWAARHAATYMGAAAPESDTSTLLMAKFRAAFAKAGDELLAGRTSGDLHKASHMLSTSSPQMLERMRSVMNKISRQAREAGAQIQLSDWRKLESLIDAGDENGFCELAENMLQQISQAAAVAA